MRSGSVHTKRGLYSFKYTYLEKSYKQPLDDTLVLM